MVSISFLSLPEELARSLLIVFLHPFVGQVLKAWDIGVLSMQRGEVCTFLCKPEYAYGPAGNPNKIPPSSTVIFEVRMPVVPFVLLNSAKVSKDTEYARVIL